MNIKKKPQRYSYKKLITASKRIDYKLNEQLNKSLQRQKNNQLSGNINTKSTKNKSAQKILSVYDSAHNNMNISTAAKFKISSNNINTNNINKPKVNTKTNEYHINLSRQQRIKTQADEFNKTKTNKIHSFRNKVNKQPCIQIKHNNYNSIKPIYTNRINNNNHNFINNYLSANNNQKQIYQQNNTINKNFSNNKKLNLNSQLFQNIKNSKDSLQKYYQIPQTSKNQKKNYSFRKGHDSYRSNKKTALEKYISESLQNLDYPLKKNKNQKISLKKNYQNKQYAIMNTLSKSKQKDTQKSKQKQTHNGHYRNKTFFSNNNNDEIITTKQIQQKANKQPANNFVVQSNQQNRRLKTQTNKQKQKQKQKQKDQDIQKIQIKWQKKKKNPYDLSNQQSQTFGDRFPDGFQKIKLLGRGGFSLVWLGQHKKSKKKYAVKQIITQSTHQTHIKQIWFGSYFFQFGGAVKKQFIESPGIKNLVKLYYYFINKKDTWLLYQKCGDSLGNCLYELKGQNYNGQKVYRIYYKQLYLMIKNDQSLLRKIILQVARALQLLAENNIVHSDLKTENILVKIKNNLDQDSKTVDAKTSGRLKSKPSQRQFMSSSSIIQQVKLIDYGSSFVFDNLRQFSMATPQYMAPQILNFILYENQLQYIPRLFDYVQQSNQSWVIDIWSLGSVILQIISGIPLWMSLKTIVKRKAKQLIRYGLFAVKGRTFDKIIKKQLQVIQNLDKYLAQQNYSDIVIQQDIKYLLKRMLTLNPMKRISPTQIIQFLTQTHNNNQNNSQNDDQQINFDH